MKQTSSSRDQKSGLSEVGWEEEKEVGMKGKQTGLPVLDIMEEPVYFGGPGTIVCLTELVLEVLQGFLFCGLHSQCFTQVGDLVLALG